MLQPCQQIEFLGLKGNSGHSKPNNDSFIKRDVKSFVEKNITISDKYLPSALNKEADWESQKQQGLLGLETVSSDLSKSQVSVWSSPDRSVGIRTIPSASSYNDTCSSYLAETTLVPKAPTIIDSRSNDHTSCQIYC